MFTPAMSDQDHFRNNQTDESKELQKLNNMLYYCSFSTFYVSIIFLRHTPVTDNRKIISLARRATS